MPHSTMKSRTLKRAMAKVFLALCLATGTIAAADDPIAAPSIMTMRVDGEITVGPTGDVIEHRITTQVQPEIRALLDSTVTAWKFEPVIMHGAPSKAKAKMRITLSALQTDMNYRIGFENVIFRAPDSRDEKISTAAEQPAVVLTTRIRKPSPKYPKGYAIDGMVLVYVRVSPQGDVEEAIAAQSTLFNAKGKPDVLAKARQSMEASAVQAIRQWKVNVATNGKTPTEEDLSASISVNYTWDPSQKSDANEVAGQWRLENRGVRRDIPWLRESRWAQRVGVSDVNPGEMMPVASPLQLRDKGKLL